MQYLADHGTWSDMPLDQVIADFAVHYPGITERARSRAQAASAAANGDRPADDLFSA